MTLKVSSKELVHIISLVTRAISEAGNAVKICFDFTPVYFFREQQLLYDNDLTSKKKLFFFCLIKNVYVPEVIKAMIVKRRLRVYKREKSISYQKFHRRKVVLAFFDKISHFWDNFLFCGICKLLMNKLLNRFSTVRKYQMFKKVLETDGTLENYVCKSVIGFFGGVLLVYIFFTFFVLQMNFPYSSSTVVCSILGLFLTLGLAFSSNVRCIVLMVLPQLFSERGRQALLAYAFLLTLSGPTKNLLHNTRVLTESLACSQEQLKAATQSIRELAKAPFYAIKVAITAVVKAFKVIIKKVKVALLAIKRVIIGLVNVIRSASDWLFGGTSMCNKKFGSPFQRCVNSINEAVSDCKVSVPHWADDMCSVAYAGALVCYPVKVVDYFCDFISFITDDVFVALKKKINDFSRHLKTMFYVKITFSHSFAFRTNQTQSIHDIASNILNEVKRKTHWFTHLFSWMSFTFLFFMVYLVYQVLYYRYRFMSSLSFDNRFLSKHLYDIDFKRVKINRETIIPLTRSERSQYLEVTSVRLLAKERRSLLKASWFLLMTSFKLSVHMLLDIALNWILLMLQRYGRLQVHIDVPNSINMRVKGKGMLADLYRGMATALKPLGLEMHMDTLPCLPNPLPPDYFRYKQIFSLLGLVWILTIFQPYAKRMRNIIMSYYHPEVAKQRAVWLYNHILRSRGSFLTYIRRQLRRKFGLRDKRPRERITLVQRCFALFPFFDWLFGQERGKVCLLCGQPETPDETLIECPTVGCIGVYCQKCYADLKNTCTICLRPIDYGDLSDISEEKDSSDDDEDDEGRRTNLKTHVDANADADADADSDDGGGKADDGNFLDSDGDETQTTATSESRDTQFSYSYQDQEFAKNGNPPLSVRPVFKDLEAQTSFLKASLSDLLSSDEEVIVINSREAARDLATNCGSLLNCASRKIDKLLIMNRYFEMFENFENGYKFEEKPVNNATFSSAPASVSNESTKVERDSGIGLVLNDSVFESEESGNCLLFMPKVDGKQIEVGMTVDHISLNNSKNQFDENENNELSTSLDVPSKSKHWSDISHQQLFSGANYLTESEKNLRKQEGMGVLSDNENMANDVTLEGNHIYVNDATLIDDASGDNAAESNSNVMHNVKGKKEIKGKQDLSRSVDSKLQMDKKAIVLATGYEWTNVLSDESGFGSSETSLSVFTSDNVQVLGEVVGEKEIQG